MQHLLDLDRIQSHQSSELGFNWDSPSHPESFVIDFPDENV
jgi:hypothetical protein